jgi:hypothetical protein
MGNWFSDPIWRVDICRPKLLFPDPYVVMYFKSVKPADDLPDIIEYILNNRDLKKIEAHDALIEVLSNFQNNALFEIQDWDRFPCVQFVKDGMIVLELQNPRFEQKSRFTSFSSAVSQSRMYLIHKINYSYSPYTRMPWNNPPNDAS